jgi:pimeloyl-ACP methyl ester carboxylesterase
MQPRNWGRLARAPFMSPRARERMLLGMTRHQGDLDEDADRYAAIAAATVPKKRNFLGQLRAALKVKAPSRVDVPTLILASKGDHLVSWRCSEAIAAKLGLPLRLHEGAGAEAAGHDLPLDAPQWIVDVVNPWLATLPPPR